MLFPRTTRSISVHLHVRGEQAGNFKDRPSMPKLVGKSFIKMRIPGQGEVSKSFSSDKFHFRHHMNPNGVPQEGWALNLESRDEARAGE